MRCLWFLVLVAYISQISAKSKTGRECAVPERERKDCGNTGVTQAQCIERGCCWAPCNGCDRRVPWCYFTQEMMSEECLIASEDKVDCGYYGIKQNECVARGCCWRPSKRPNDPWCFTSKHATTTSTSTTRRTTTTTTEPTTPEYGFEGMVRLEDGYKTVPGGYSYYYDYNDAIGYTGRLEIYHEGAWGTVCDDGFNDLNAQVVCKQLGWYGGTYRGEAYYGEGEGTIWMDQVSCTGDESGLEYCDHQGWGSNDCSHAEDVSVECDTQDTSGGDTGPGSEGDIRLVSGSSANEGRVEVYHDGEWGTVCDDAFESVDAEVVCRQLGYSPVTAQVFDSAYFGEGSGKTWIDDVNCAGHEPKLVDCSFSCWECEDCGHSEDVGVRCEGELATTVGPTTEEPIRDGELRIAAGTGDSEWSGRLEIFHDNQWGTICDDAFGTDSARVACRELGLGGGDYRGSAYYGEGDGPTWLDGIYCTGDEERLVDCEHAAWGDEDCSHSEDIGIICEAEPVPPPTATVGNDEVRLMNGNSSSGRVEVFFESQWGTVCDDLWDDADATVVCRMLGFSSGTVSPAETFGQAEDDMPIWLDNVQCTGLEQSIHFCNATVNDSDCTHLEDAGVYCSGEIVTDVNGVSDEIPVTGFPVEETTDEAIEVTEMDNSIPNR